MSFKQKYIGDKSFYKMLLRIVLPIIAQNAITNFVGLLDNLMVGRTGTDPMNGVSVANQIIFVFNLIIFGAVAGAGIFAAQYYGQGDHKGVRYAFRYKLIVCTLAAAVGIIVFAFFRENLVSLYISESSIAGCDPEATLKYGSEYMYIMMFGLLPFALSQSYTGTLRETGETIVPMAAGISAVVVNLCFNYLLIFGKFGFPELGAVGAAIATVISRFVELAIVVIWTHTHKERNPFAVGLYKGMYIPKDVVKKITIKGLPLLANEALWSMAIAAISQCYSIRGLEVVGAQNISTTVSNLFNVVFLSMGLAVSIIVGQALGAGETEKAVDLDRKLIFISVASCAVTGALLAAISPFFPQLYNTDPEIRSLATKFILCVAAGTPLQAFANAAYFTMRSGGKTMITFVFDSVMIWCVNYVLVFTLTHYATGMSVVAIMFCEQMSNIIKCCFGYYLVKKRKWVNNLVAKS